MKRQWSWGLLLGTLIGTAAGYGLSSWVFSMHPANGSSLLHNFSFQGVARKAGHPAWEFIEDKTYSPFPPLGRPKRISRRIVARASMSEKELETFASHFQTAVEEALNSYGAHLTGEHDRSRSVVGVAPGGAVRSEFQLPRWYYRAGDTHGVADAWLIGQSGEVTVIVSLTE